MEKPAIVLPVAVATFLCAAGLPAGCRIRSEQAEGSIRLTAFAIGKACHVVAQLGARSCSAVTVFRRQPVPIAELLQVGTAGLQVDCTLLRAVEDSPQTAVGGATPVCPVI